MPAWPRLCVAWPPVEAPAVPQRPAVGRFVLFPGLRRFAYLVRAAGPPGGANVCTRSDGYHFDMLMKFESGQQLSCIQLCTLRTNTKIQTIRT